MTRLKRCFEEAGMQNVSTYINSGNVVFNSTLTHSSLVMQLERAIEQTFGFGVKVLIRSLPQIQAVMDTMPSTWANDTSQKSDVMFLWEQFDSPDTLKALRIKPTDTVLYVAGALLWNVAREHQSKSAMLEMMGTPLYKQMTIRNCNTVRKLHAMMLSCSSPES